MLVSDLEREGRLCCCCCCCGGGVSGTHVSVTWNWGSGHGRVVGWRDVGADKG